MPTTPPSPLAYARHLRDKAAARAKLQHFPAYDDNAALVRAFRDLLTWAEDEPKRRAIDHRRVGDLERNITMLNQVIAVGGIALDDANDLYASIKRKLGQEAGDGKLPHDAIDALNARLENVEAHCAEMRDRLEKIRGWRDKKWYDGGDRPSSPPAVLLCLDSALYSDAGRALLNRLKTAEAALVTAGIAQATEDD